MKNYVVSFISILLLNSSILAQNCNEYPRAVLGKRVYDYYNKIEDNAERKLEELVLRFEDSTGMQFAILTLKDLGDKDEETYARELGNCWGVGEKGVDNGIVFLVSFEDRKAQISTGRTTQIYLTDYAASKIRLNILNPNLQAGDPTKAITETVEAIIAHLGWNSFEEREREALLQKERNAANLKKVGYAIFILAIIVVIFILIRKLMQINKLRRKATNALELMSSKVTPLPDIAREGWPNWAVKLYEGFVTDYTSAHKYYVTQEAEVKSLIKKDPERAIKKANEVEHDLIFKLQNYVEEINNLPTKIAQYKNKSLTEMKSLKERLFFISKFLEAQKKIGFLIEKEETDFSILSEDITKASSKLNANNPDSYKEVLEEMEGLKARINPIVAPIEKAINLRSNIADGESLRLEVSKLIEKLPEYNIQLNFVKQKYSQEVWTKINNINDVELKLSKLDQTISDAVLKSSLKIQKFDEASDMLNLIQTTILFAKGTFEAIDFIKKSQAKAESSFSSEQSKFNSSIEQAEKKCKHSDVGRSARSIATDARSKYKEAIKESEKEKINWVNVIALLTVAISLAESSYKKAQSDIEDAERRREEEERRRRQRREEESRRSSMSSSSSSYSSSSSGRGFGGGRFGGSGAGGSW